MNRGNPYEAAFEAYLRQQGTSYFAIDESKRNQWGLETETIKTPDFIVMTNDGSRIVVEIKGRRYPSGPASKPRRVWENWTTREDVNGLSRWSERINGVGLFVFLYQLGESVHLPNDVPDLWSFRDERYLIRTIPVDSYRRWMRTRSPKWGTVCLPNDVYRELVEPWSIYTTAEILWPA